MRIRCSRRFCTSSRTWRSGRTTRDFTRSWRRSRTRPRYAWRAILSCADGAWAEAPGRRARRVRGTRRRARRRDAGRRRDDRARARLRRDDVWAARRRRTYAIIRRIQDAPRRIARDAPPREVRIPARRILATSSSSTDRSIADHRVFIAARYPRRAFSANRIETRARARTDTIARAYEYSCHHRNRLRLASRTTTHTSRSLAAFDCSRSPAPSPPRTCTPRSRARRGRARANAVNASSSIARARRRRLHPIVRSCRAHTPRDASTAFATATLRTSRRVDDKKALW